MREIKFRAWDKERKEMIGAERLIHLEGETTKQLKQSAPFLELMQFTGLHDKNGKEIWEGDIVSLGEEGHQGRYQIVFFDGSFCVDWHDVESKHRYAPIGNYCNDVFINCIEVIGNIYENPELLEAP
jgi:uncharacterized phage protein (TIGR01671 family)